MRVIPISGLFCAILMSPAAFAQETPTSRAVEAVEAIEAVEAVEAAEAVESTEIPEAGGTAEAAPQEQAEADEADAPQVTDTGTDVATASSIPAPPEGKGQIVFFRDRKFSGGGVSYIVREEKAELGKLSNGSWFVHVAEPGAHAYTVHSETKDVLNLEVEAGETYYVAGTISVGILAGRPNLSPSDQASFDALAGKIKPSKPLKK